MASASKSKTEVRVGDDVELQLQTVEAKHARVNLENKTILLKCATKDDIKVARDRFPGSSKVFELEIDTTGFAPVVHPRSTLLNALLPKPYSTYAFKFLTGRLFIVLSMATVLLVAPPSLLSFLGVIPYQYCWLTMLAVPTYIVYVPLLNTDLLRLLGRSAEFWGLVVLTLIGCAGLLDATRLNVGRAIAALFFGTTSFIVMVADARYPRARPNPSMQWVLGWIVVTQYIFIGCWYTGQIPDIQIRTFTVGTVHGDFQSISMSCLVTNAILNTKYLVSVIRHPHMLLILKPRIRYVLVAKEEPLDNQVLAAVDDDDDVEQQ